MSATEGSLYSPRFVVVILPSSSREMLEQREPQSLHDAAVDLTLVAAVD